MARRRTAKPQTTMSKKPNGRARTRKAKDRPLPGMEDHAIKPLETIATEYADIRDQRMELTKEEVGLKAKALRLMKSYGKTVYKHGGVEIRVVAGEDAVKVKIHEPKEDAPAGAAADDGAQDESHDGGEPF